jgi:hypothetical protein
VFRLYAARFGMMLDRNVAAPGGWEWGRFLLLPGGGLEELFVIGSLKVHCRLRVQQLNAAAHLLACSYGFASDICMLPSAAPTVLLASTADV